VGWHSQFSDLLQDGWFEVQMVVGKRDFFFSTIIQIGSTESHSASCIMGTRAPSWGKSGKGVVLTAQPHLAPRFKKE